MTNPKTTSSSRGGYLILAVVVVAIAAIVIAVKLKPPSSAERRDEAIDVCKTAVDGQAPTEWRKLWQGVDVDGFQFDDGKKLTVTGEFSTKDSGMRPFTCVVEDGKLVSATVQP